MELHGLWIDDGGRFESQDVAGAEGGAAAGLGQVDESVEVGLDRCGVQWCAVGEGDAVTQGEGVVQAVRADLPLAGQPRDDLAGVGVLIGEESAMLRMTERCSIQ